jgi:methyl-accepting chemotaxis protein
MKSWSLNFKIGIILTVFAIGTLIVSFFGLQKMASINDILTEVTEKLVKRDQITSLILDNQREVTILNKEMIIEKNQKKMVELEKGLEIVRIALLNSISNYEEIASQEGKELAKQYRENLDSWIAANAELRKFTKENNDEAVAEVLKVKEIPRRTKLLSILKEMNKITANSLKEGSVLAAETYLNARNILAIISLGIILFCTILSIIIMKIVSKNINEVIDSLNDNSTQVTSAAQQIAASSEELSQAATEQASSLEETASSIEEMNSMVQKNSENAQRTSHLAESSSASAEKGKEVVREMIVAIDDISSSNNTIMEQIDYSNQQISDIVKVIGEIGEKTKVINDIVFQTKLLSFNASVEAARAGEHGKGFAVVAEEVGSLAQMSGNAAKEITAMLDNSIAKVEGIVNETKQKVTHLINDGKNKVDIGSKIAKDCGSVLEEIVKNVKGVTQMANEISTACQEQAQGVQEITRAMNQLDQVTQTNAATSEEAASAAEELSSQSDSLKAVVGILVSTIKGDKGNNGATGPIHQKISSSSTAKVIPLNPKKSASSGATYNLKKAVGATSSSIPNEDDPRFTDV